MQLIVVFVQRPVKDMLPLPPFAVPWKGQEGVGEALGLLMLVMAHQLVAGVSKEARLWVDRAFALVLIGGLLPPFVRAAVESALTRSILAATALVVLLLAAVWLLRRARRRSRPS